MRRRAGVGIPRTFGGRRAWRAERLRRAIVKGVQGLKGIPGLAPRMVSVPRKKILGRDNRAIFYFHQVSILQDVVPRVKPHPTPTCMRSPTLTPLWSISLSGLLPMPVSCKPLDKLAHVYVSIRREGFTSKFTGYQVLMGYQVRTTRGLLCNYRQQSEGPRHLGR